MDPHHSSFMTSQPLHPCSYDHIWQSIYSNTDLYQVGQERTVCLPFPTFGPICHLQDFTLDVKALLSMQANHHNQKEGRAAVCCTPSFCLP